MTAGKAPAPEFDDAADMGTAFGLDYALDRNPTAPLDAPDPAAGTLMAPAAPAEKRSRWRRGG
jgi:hypothetical protein